MGKGDNLAEAWWYEKNNMRTKLHIKLSSAVEPLMGEGNEAKRSLYRITASIPTPLNAKLDVAGRSQNSALRNVRTAYSRQFKTVWSINEKKYGIFH